MKAFLAIIMTIRFIKQVSAQCDPPCLPDNVCQPFNDTYYTNNTTPTTISGFECVCNPAIYDNPDFKSLLKQQTVSCSQNILSMNITECLGRKIMSSGLLLPDGNIGQNPCFMKEEPSYPGIATYYFTLTSSDPNCVVKPSTDSTFITYFMNVTFAIDPETEVIMANNITVTYICSYPLQYNTTLDGPLTSYISTESVSVAGYGTFVTTVGLFTDASYSTPYTDNATLAPVAVGTPIYIKASVNADPNKYSIRVDTAYLTPSKNPDDAIKYFLINGGCTVPGTTAHVNINGNSNSASFSFGLIKFANFPNVNVYITVTICLGNCAKDCVIRDASNDTDVGTTSHKLGPIPVWGETSGSGTCVSFPWIWKMWTLLALLMISVM